MNYKTGFTILIFFFVSASLFPHHAMEYIEMESYSTARKGEIIFHLHFDYMVDDRDNSAMDHWEFTPGFSYGITDRLMADIHTHYAKFGSGHASGETEFSNEVQGFSPFIEAAAFSLQYRLTRHRKVNIALAATFELPMKRSRDILGGENVFEGMVIASFEFGNHSNITVNLATGIEGEHSFTEWAVGVKTPLTGNPHGIASGVEMLGDFEGGLSVLAGVYFPLGSENLIFKTGLEFSSGSSRANTTLMARF